MRPSMRPWVLWSRIWRWDLLSTHLMSRIPSRHGRCGRCGRYGTFKRVHVQYVKTQIYQKAGHVYWDMSSSCSCMLPSKNGRAWMNVNFVAHVCMYSMQIMNFWICAFWSVSWNCFKNPVFKEIDVSHVSAWCARMLRGPYPVWQGHCCWWSCVWRSCNCSQADPRLNTLTATSDRYRLYDLLKFRYVQNLRHCTFMIFRQRTITKARATHRWDHHSDFETAQTDLRTFV